MVECRNMTNQKKRILLIDDNEVMRMMFSNIFWLHGLDDEYELETISSISQAEERFADHTKTPHIIFTGLVMPFEKDGKTVTSAEAGFTLLKRIKDDPKLSHIRVVIFSSFDDQEFREQAMTLGAYQYLNKSDSMPQDIIQTIRTISADTA